MGGPTLTDYAEFPELEDVDPDLILPPEVIDKMTEAEIGAYLEALHTNAKEWRLQPHQQRAEDMCAQVDEILFGGSAGPGKTEWLMWHCYHQCLKYPGLRVLMIRRTFPQLRRSLIERSLLRFDQKLAKYMPSEKRWKFNNGSEIEFGFCDADEDYRHYLSAEADVIAFEELTEMTYLQYVMISSRCRTTTKKLKQGIRPHVISATNPGLAGHAWVREYFVHSTNYGENIAERVVKVGNDEHVRTVAFVPAKVTDNKFIDPRYVAALGALPEHQRKLYLEGDWDAFEGAYFPEFSRDVHVIEPFLVPKEWPRVRGIDYGLAKPFACIWAAFDHDGNAYVYREAYQTDLTATDQARLIDRMSRYPDSTEAYGRHAGRPEEFVRTVIDPSTFNKQGSGTSIAQMYANEGLHATKAMNARVDGWNRIKDYLRGQDHPKLFIFRTCPNLIREMTSVVRDDHNPEDLDTTMPDHACLAAGTLVTTDKGLVPIELVRPGDRVWTRAGYFPVLHAEQTAASAELLEVEMEGGTRLVGTANHPVWADGRWVPLGDLLDHTPYLDTLHQIWIPSGSPTPASRTKESCTICAATTSSETASACIVGSGLTPTDPSPRVATGTSTTSITTAATTPWRTLSSWMGLRTSSTTVSTSRAFRSLRRLTLRRRLGTGAPRGRHGTPATGRHPGRDASGTSPASATSAAKTFLPGLVASPVSVPTPASRPGDVTPASTTSTTCAQCAESRTGRTSTPSPRLAPVRVLSVSAIGSGPVYNLAVDGPAHEYLGNGVLLSNCDALRYALAARGRQAKKKKDVAPPWALSSRLDAIMKDRRQQRGNVGF